MPLPLPFLFLFGLAFGSFANVVIYRVPRGESVISPPSHCPACNARLTPLELVPVLGFLLRRGRCGHCGAKISRRYPFIELLCALLFIFVPWRLCLFAFFLLCISAIDVDSRTISDVLVACLAFSGLLYVKSVKSAVLGALLGAGVILLIDYLTMLFIKKDGFGYGDAVLMGGIGFVLGLEQTIVTLFLAFILGGVCGVVIKIIKSEEQYMPFAPCLSAAALLSARFGQPLFDWYITLINANPY